MRKYNKCYIRKYIYLSYSYTTYTNNQTFQFKLLKFSHCPKRQHGGRFWRIRPARAPHKQRRGSQRKVSGHVCQASSIGCGQIYLHYVVRMYSPHQKSRNMFRCVKKSGSNYCNESCGYDKMERQKSFLIALYKNNTC